MHLQGMHQACIYKEYLCIYKEGALLEVVVVVAASWAEVCGLWQPVGPKWWECGGGAVASSSFLVRVVVEVGCG